MDTATDIAFRSHPDADHIFYKTIFILIQMILPHNMGGMISQNLYSLSLSLTRSIN